jgi:hypothetical protein
VKGQISWHLQHGTGGVIMTDEPAREYRSSTVRRHGKVVFVHEWDSGGPAAGASQDFVYFYDDRYFSWHEYDGEFDGPFDSLTQAILEGEMGAGTGTISIDCTELDADELAKRVPCFGDEEQEIQLNGEDFVVWNEELVRAEDVDSDDDDDE